MPFPPGYGLGVGVGSVPVRIHTRRGAHGKLWAFCLSKFFENRDMIYLLWSRARGPRSGPVCALSVIGGLSGRAAGGGGLAAGGTGCLRHGSPLIQRGMPARVSVKGFPRCGSGAKQLP